MCYSSIISQTPPEEYSSMLVFDPPSLPQIFESLITNFPPSLRNAQPANTLYMLARFACLTCDPSWLEDLIIGATDAIEETFFVSLFFFSSSFSRSDLTLSRVVLKTSPAWSFGCIIQLFGFI
jgi:hypothetical protein